LDAAAWSAALGANRIIILCGGVGILAGSCAVAAEQVVPAPASISGIPPAYLVLYEQAAQRFGLQWQILAGIGRVETDHGQDGAGCTANFAGARGRCSSSRPRSPKRRRSPASPTRTSATRPTPYRGRGAPRA